MRLHDLAELLITARVVGDPKTSMTGLEVDSRKVRHGDVFICLTGHSVDGHLFAAEAVANGAVAIVAERLLELEVPQLIVKDSRFALATIAAHWFGYPSRSLKLIGVTGTNGKTPTTYLIEQILNAKQKPTGVIGTIEMRYAGQSYPMKGTTPHALELQQSLGAMRDAGMQYCVMEVSSHALEQGRVKGCRFRTAIFTNLTQDHLDYHETMEQYAAIKGLFFSRLGNDYALHPDERVYAIMNADDPVSAMYRKLTSAEVITYGIAQEADIKASNIRISAQGTQFQLSTFRGSTEILLPMAGKFNVYNALAAIASALVEGVELAVIKEALERIPGVPGRMEAVRGGQDFAVFVDYAHTPDGLENVLRTAKEFAEQRLICVFGCGGDRDRTKRPLMGRIAAEYADCIVITSDNPRSEDPIGIMQNIEEGLLTAGIEGERYCLVNDRKQAIQKAIEMASPGDVVLIAGKGHETYQIINGVTYPFDDRIVALEAIRGLLL